MNAWIRGKLRDWLGITEAEELAANAESFARQAHDEIVKSKKVMIDLGLSERSNTVIIVASTLGNGRVVALSQNFGSLSEFQQFMDAHFPYWRKSQRIIDAPYGAREGVRL